MAKAAVLLLADTEIHADMGHAANALTTVEDFAEHGDQVALVFDGAGTRWAAELVKEENELHPAFEKVRDKVAGACHYCAGAFDVREELEQSGVPLLREHKGHPSVRSLVDDGFEVITF
ncbi:MAG: DsrE family protein [Thermoleophilaceae bacterium]